jgi:TonB-dependent Receptor Plug Domain/CarboxypepD_reg-like domain
MKPVPLILLLIGLFSANIFAQKFTISGFVSDAESGEKLLAASVFDKKSGQGTVTNNYGFYSLTLSSDSVQLICTFIGQQPQQKRLKLSKNESINFELGASSTLKEVVISSERAEKIEDRAQMGRIDVPIQQIKTIPALLGEVDVLKALQLLPGVSSGGEGQSGIYVRGGSPDQNLILLDGVPVYNVSHLFGFFSVFNADAIRDVTLTKGGFPARYGGRLSSVIEINLKEGNENEFHGEGSVGLIASRLTLEGPIKKNKTSFIVSGRRTYLDILARPLIKSALKSDDVKGVIGYYFYDFNAKINHKISDKDRLYLSFYGGKDRFYADLEDIGNENYSSISENSLDWGNITSALRWNHIWSPRLFSNTTLTYSKYAFNTSVGIEDREKFAGQPDIVQSFRLKYGSGINDLAGRIDFDFNPNPAHYIRFGAHIIAHNFDPGQFETRIVDTQEPSDIKTVIGNKIITAPEYSTWIEDDFKVTDRLKINAGLHLSAFTSKQKTWPSIQPRINIRWLFDGGYAIKGGFSTMRQYIHLLTNENIGLPTDLWLPTTNKVRPENSWQAAIGLAKTFREDYEVSFESYYKKMNGVIAFKEGESLLQFTNWEDRITQGNGESYGGEFFVQKKKGKFTGWVGYTLSWTNRQFDDLNYGKKYPFKYDRRHDLELVGSYKFSERFRLSATWVYGTGNAVTLAESTFYTLGNYYGTGSFDYPNQVSYFKDRNNFRQRAYHRLDVGLEFHKKKKHHERTWSWGAYNAYSRANPFFIYTTTDSVQNPDGTYSNKTKLRQASLFPIIPYLAYGFKF